MAALAVVVESSGRTTLDDLIEGRLGVQFARPAWHEVTGCLSAPVAPDEPGEHEQDSQHAKHNGIKHNGIGGFHGASEMGLLRSPGLNKGPDKSWKGLSNALFACTLNL